MTELLELMGLSLGQVLGWLAMWAVFFGLGYVVGRKMPVVADEWGATLPRSDQDDQPDSSDSGSGQSGQVMTAKGAGGRWPQRRR